MQDKIPIPLMRCPGQQTLDDFARGKLSATTSDDVAQHLRQCVDCESQMEVLLDTDSFALVWRQPALDATLFQSPAFRKLIEDACELGGDTSNFGNDETRDRKRLGEYQLLEELGSGGMGVVYKALHTKLDRTVAVKLLRSKWCDDRAVVGRFFREMKALGRVDHANVVQATDAQEVDGTHFLAMQYVEGVDLSRLVHRVGPLPVAAACEAVRQAALGLEHIRSCDMVHRDIKASNLILTREGERAVVKILDLGLALVPAAPDQDEESLTKTNANLLGTPDYMAPEQADGASEVDNRADIYSLGCVFYKLLVGAAPFQHKKLGEKLAAHRQERAPDVRQRRPEVGGDVSAILAKMLAKKPGDRQTSPGEIAKQLEGLSSNDELTDVLEKAPQDARLPIPSLEPKVEIAIPVIRQWNKLPVILASVILLALVAGVGVRSMFTLPPPNFQQLAPEEIEYGRHYPLLDQAPSPLYLPSDSGESSYTYDYDAKRLVVSSRERTWLSFGSVERTEYDFSIDIYQNEWPGRSGIFFGYRQTEFGPEPRWQYQLIELHRKRDSEGAEKRLRIDRAIGWIRHRSDGRRVFEDEWSCASQIVGWPGGHRQTLRVIVRDDGIDKVYWGGELLEAICSPQANHPALPKAQRLTGQDYLGQFGVQVYRSDTTFSNVGIEFFRPLVPLTVEP